MQLKNKIHDNIVGIPLLFRSMEEKRLKGRTMTSKHLHEYLIYALNHKKSCSESLYGLMDGNKKYY